MTEGHTPDLIERLRHFTLFLSGSAAINGAWFGDNADGERGKFWWRKYLPLTEAADEITALRDRVAALEGVLVAEREENLWNAYYGGHVRDGKWDHLCMSDGEQLAAECGFNASDGRFDDEAIRAAIPKAARSILSRAQQGGGDV